MVIQKKLELTIREKEKLQKELGKMENSLQNLQEKVKISTNGVKTNKDDFKQTVQKMEQKVAQAMHEIRKKETNMGKMQEQYRKATKDTLLYKNTIDMTSRLNSEGINFTKEKSCGSNDLLFMLKNGYEESQRKLIEENSRLKECLELTHKEIVNMLNKAIQMLKNIWSEKKSEKCIEPIQLKPIVFQMPLGTLISDIYQIFRENIGRMKDCLDAIISNCQSQSFNN